MRQVLKPLAFLVLCLVWSSTWLVIKVGYGGLGPFNVAAVRFLLAGLLLAPMIPVLGLRWPLGREWRVVLLVGLALFGVEYGLVYWGEQYIDSGLTAVLFAVYPLLTALAAHVYLPAERLTLRKLSGILLAFLGVVVLFADRLRLDPALALPMLAIVVGAAFAAVTTVGTKRHGHGLHPVALNGPAMLVGGAFLTLASLAAGDGFRLPSDALTWGAVAYLALAGSILTFLLFFWLLKSWDATALSFVSVITPALALVLGHLVLQEQPQAWTFLGTLLILGGIILAQWKPRTERNP